MMQVTEEAYKIFTQYIEYMYRNNLDIVERYTVKTITYHYLRNDAGANDLVAKRSAGKWWVKDLLP